MNFPQVGRRNSPLLWWMVWSWVDVESYTCTASAFLGGKIPITEKKKKIPNQNGIFFEFQRVVVGKFVLIYLLFLFNVLLFIRLLQDSSLLFGSVMGIYSPLPCGGSLQELWTLFPCCSSCVCFPQVYRTFLTEVLFLWLFRDAL